jgi:hypothetical protein
MPITLDRPTVAQVLAQPKTAAFPQDWKTWEREVSKLIAKAWMNEELYERLAQDPAGTLAEAGLILEDFVTVEINRNPNAVPVLRAGENGKVIYELPLPAKPASVSDSELRAWVEGRSGVGIGHIPISC